MKMEKGEETRRTISEVRHCVDDFCDVSGKNVVLECGHQSHPGKTTCHPLFRRREAYLFAKAIEANDQHSLWKIYGCMELLLCLRRHRSPIRRMSMLLVRPGERHLKDSCVAFKKLDLKASFLSTNPTLKSER